MKGAFRHIIILAFIFILCLSFATAQKGVINGTVQGVEGALQAATVVAGKITVLTDNSGRFSLSIDPGHHHLEVTHAGYKKIVQEVTVTAGNTQTFHLTLLPSEEMGSIVVLGSRSVLQRSNLHTPVPVDVFSTQQLVQTGQTSLTQMLQFAAPSFNASRPLLNEPVTLRGLNPDQVLILVNGTRRHSMAYINHGGVRGILGGGAVSNDLNAIPFSAIEKIEILRDGASAQYGSDAIAGVINIILKKSTGRTTALLQSGQFYKGDGESITAGINHGISLNKRGFLNFSADFRHNNPTTRGGEYIGTVYRNIFPTTSRTDSLRIRALDDSIVQARGFNRKGVSNAGSSKHTTGGLLMNGGYFVGKNTELFWTAAANKRKSTFRSGFTFPKNLMRINPELFPDGFGALPYHNSFDFSSIAGAKGETRMGWHWEYSTAYGNNRDRYSIKNTNNPSQYFTLGKDAPTSFYTGTLTYGQLTHNFHVSKNISAKPEQSLNLGFGAEWRQEHFRMQEGEEGSWNNYDSLSRKMGGSTGLIVHPENSINKSRNVTGTYIDFESEFARRFLLHLAGRYEYYNDFGSNLAGKLAARYKVADHFSVRGSINNSFRAPSLQQRYYSGTNRTVTNIGGQLVPSTTGIFRNDHEVTQAFGIPFLEAERSVNGSVGFAGTLLNHIRLTVDVYWIQIKNRIVLSDTFGRRSNPEVNRFLSDFKEIDQVRFFTNAINTRTRGVDAVLNGNWKIKEANLAASLAANVNQTRLFGAIKAAGRLTPDSLNLNTLFSRQERGKLEKGQPQSKIILSLHYKTNQFGFLLRNTRFGRTSILSNNLALNPDEHFSPKILTDISFSYTPKSWLTATAGTNNIFDVYPDRINDYRNTQEGTLIYGQEATPFGFNGGYYFITMGLHFPTR